MQKSPNEKKFNLERIIVYKIGDAPTEQESHNVIVTILSHELDEFILLAVKSYFEKYRRIPILELREWKGSPDEIDKGEIDGESLNRMSLKGEYILKIPDSNVYRVCFIISGQTMPSSIRSHQMQEIERLLIPFRNGQAGPNLGSIELEFSLKNIYELFTPGQLVDKDIWIADETIISPKATFIPPVLIGKGCLINDNAVIGPGVIAALCPRIGQGSIISQSIALHLNSGDRSMIQNILHGKDILYDRKKDV